MPATSRTSSTSGRSWWLFTPATCSRTSPEGRMPELENLRGAIAGLRAGRDRARELVRSNALQLQLLDQRLAQIRESYSTHPQDPELPVRLERERASVEQKIAAATRELAGAREQAVA